MPPREASYKVTNCETEIRLHTLQIYTAGRFGHAMANRSVHASKKHASQYYMRPFATKTQLENMSIDPNFVELTADVLLNTFTKQEREKRINKKWKKKKERKNNWQE